MVLWYRRGSSESLPSSPVTDTQAAGPASPLPPLPLLSPRCVYRQKFQRGPAGGMTLHILLKSYWSDWGKKCLKTSSRRPVAAGVCVE